MEMKQTFLFAKNSAVSILFSGVCKYFFFFFPAVKQGEVKGQNYLKYPSKAKFHSPDILTCHLCLGTFCAEASSKS